MSKVNQDDLLIFFDVIKQQFLNFSKLYAKAVKSGANVAGKQIIEAVGEVDKPTDITAGKLVTAFKSGALNASDKMISSLNDYINQMKKN